MTVQAPSARARDLFEEVGANDKGTYNKGEVRALLRNIADCNGCVDGIQKVSEIRRGDVFIAKLVGGKVRPWIVLSVRGGTVVAVAMSSGDSAPRMIKSKCRLWPSSWIGSTVSLFDPETASEAVTRPYTNMKHLREIEGHLAANFSLRVLRKAKK